MARKTFVQIMSDSKHLVDALKLRKTNLPTGVNEEQLTSVDTLHTKAQKLNLEQEKLKAELKSKTAELEAVTNQLEKETATIRKYTKLGIPPEQWREFGIEDKR